MVYYDGIHTRETSSNGSNSYSVSRAPDVSIVQSVGSAARDESPDESEARVNAIDDQSFNHLDNQASSARTNSRDISLEEQKDDDQNRSKNLSESKPGKNIRNETSDNSRVTSDQVKHKNSSTSHLFRLDILQTATTNDSLFSKPTLIQPRRSASLTTSDHPTDKMNGYHSFPLTPAQQAEYHQHQQYLRDINKDNRSTREEEARTAPLFSGEIMTRIPELYPQYGLLGKELPETLAPIANGHVNPSASLSDPRVMLNVGAPWSAFICGQQGSGKSHSLSCILENCLIQSPISNLPKPLSGMVFHWDRFTGYSSHQICEAAYLASAGIPVRVLVSPSNFMHMRDAYENLKGITNAFHKPKVMPLLFHEKQLNVKRMLTMMGIKTGGDELPLYMEVVLRILREMALEGQGHNGLDYSEFRNRLLSEQFTGQQNGPLKLRLELLESFLRTTSDSKARSKASTQPKPTYRPHDRDHREPPPVQIKPLKTLSFTQEAELKEAWTFRPGTLTIIDLSCPFVDEQAACALFAICLELFLEDRSSAGRVVALDEAHKFLTGSVGATAFTEELLQVIRQQRHLGTRVVIATQEPTISPSLLELCNFTLVHRFQSPGWFKTLQAHLAGASSTGIAFDDDDTEGPGREARAKSLFKRIVNLQCGQALLFAPSAITGLALAPGGNELEPVKLGMNSLRIGTRQRLTIDGGRSIMAE